LTDTKNVDADKRVVTDETDNRCAQRRCHYRAKKSGFFRRRPHVRGVGEVKDRDSYNADSWSMA
jgi:hypothetical protein